ncbi:MAG: BtrH N-terminal domain-containing protein [Cocleimonas sp.]|nr:BtrH N-terminal domain-containing protein [Cocleimonas sp.]
MKIEKFNPLIGQHCETTATGSLLRQLDIELSEPMLFGLGEGLGFIYWNMKFMDFPFIGGRVKPLVLSQSLSKNLKLTLEIKETTSIKKAWRNVTDYIEKGKAVGLQLDCYHLDYFTSKVHFAGHFVAIYGYDDEYSYLIDTKQQGGLVKTSLVNLEKARAERGPMSSKNLMYVLSRKNENYNIMESVQIAITNNAHAYLTPPIKNIGYKGILKMSVEIKKWFKNSKNREYEFATTAMLMEKAGTGGALFRNMYRDFLKESYEITDKLSYQKSYLEFIEIALLWTEVSELFDRASQSEDITYINKASDILVKISEMEVSAMRLLQA